MTTPGEDAIEALRLLCKEALGDFIYDIRDSELLGWDGPRVKNWNDAVMLARAALKRADAEGL